MNNRVCAIIASKLILSRPFRHDGRLLILQDR